MIKKIFTSVLFLGGFVLTSQAQTYNVKDASVRAKIQGFAQEVFKGYPAYVTPTLLSLAEEHLSRFEFKKQLAVANENYPLLSQVYFINKYNADLTKDFGTQFNPNTFNPLKYALEYDAKVDMVYRVDNTDYIILIHKSTH